MFDFLRGVAILNALERMTPKTPFHRLRFRPNILNLASYRSKYKPHQGEGEKARRRRQIERGILKAENGLVTP